MIGSNISAARPERLAISEGRSSRAAILSKARRSRPYPTPAQTQPFRTAPYDISTYQTTHLNGGAIMGTDPTTSALNRYLQSWDVSNLFVLGASAFPQNTGYNPTLTVGALAYWAGTAIRDKYLRTPGDW